jgi:hypothetical protein
MVRGQCADAWAGMPSVAHTGGRARMRGALADHPGLTQWGSV